MKRRVVSFIIILALCLNLCPAWALAAESTASEPYTEIVTLNKNENRDSPYKVAQPVKLDTAQYTITGTKSTAIVVTGTGKLTLVGTVVSKKGAGVEVQAGGELYIMPGTRITGTTSALSIEEGATVEAFQGSTFFDADGNVLSLDNLASAKTVTVGECTGHGSKTYTHNAGTPSHTWTCDYCGFSETEKCSFDFEEDGTGTCEQNCGNSLSIDVNQDDLSNLVYDGTLKPTDVGVTVTLTDGSNTELERDTDFKVDIKSITDAGQATVTVTGITFNGTFVKTYTVAQATPGLAWASSGPVAVNYDGQPVAESELPYVNITAVDDLRGYLQYSHKKQDDTAYTDGLPTDAGTYDVIASLPELPNFEGAVSEAITLTVNPINPIVAAPVATTPTYNRTAQELVTAGQLNPVAVADGLEIQFATSKTGTYSTVIPTGTDADTYDVWYRVAGLTGNYTAPASNPAEVSGVEIQRKAITPVVELSEYTYLYDGGFKQPDVTVKDDDNVTVLLNTEYKVAYENNRNVSTDTNPAKVVVTDSDANGGNYDLTTVTVEFKITSKTQDTLSITNKPATFTYGDTFTLGTEGGSGNGLVTWEIINGADVAKVDANSGQVTITGVGEVTVKATKSGKDLVNNEVNYEDAVAIWTFTTCKAEQNELVIEDKPAVTNYGDNFKLTTSGGSGNGLVTWEIINGADVAKVDANSGQVTITGVGEVTVKATKSGKDPDTKVVNYEDAFAQWTFTAAPRPVTATVTVSNKPYDGTITATVASASIATVNSDTVTIDRASITATFDTPNVGTGKTVTLLTHNVQVSGADASKYAISFPDSVTADITQATTTITTAPAAIAPLTYNGQAQALVTEGQTNVGFLVYSLDGTTFSREIPTGTDAGTYNIYYKVDGTTDYTGVAVNAAPISVTIAPKPITPKIELSESSFLYDGAKKEPKITLKDGETVIPESQYTVTWAGTKSQTDDDMLRVADTYTATITNVATGNNYTFSVPAFVEITPADQTALKITGKPAHVYYGDMVTTLDTTGGTGDTEAGTVTWEISSTGNNARIDADTGVLTITGVGYVTVRAKRTVPNYGTVGDFWNFTVEPKPVTAAVSVTSKTYDGTTNVANTAITAQVKAADLVNGDTVGLSGLKGTYADPNVGTGKTVTLDSTGATATGTDAAKYTVSYPATATGDITPKNVTVTVTLTDHDLKTDANGQYYEYDGTEKKPNVIVEANDGAKLTDNDYSVTYADNKNVSTDNKKATVAVTAKAGGNYTFADATANFEIRKAAAGLTSTPQANNLTYTGAPQELVSVGTATGGHIEYRLISAPTGESAPDSDFGPNIPKGTRAGTYTVEYKVVGDANHTDTAQGQVSVTIQPKTVVSPNITVSGTYTYDGTAKEPGTAVTVEDGGTTIPDAEYTLSYRDNVNAGTATVIVTDNNGGNYTVNGTATFEIGEAAATVGTAPTGKTGLKYNGTAQELITAGSSGDGTMVYSLSETGEYSAAIPTGKAVGEYEIWYKVQGDANHSDSTATKLADTVKIEKNTVANPTIQVTPASVKFTGEKQEPAITVKDDNGLLIDGSEYTVAYADAANSNNSDLTQVGTYTVTITEVANGNYTFNATDGKNTAEFKITPADQTALTITGTRERVTYGDTIQLGTTGGIDGGAVTWAVSNNNIADITNGLLTVNGVGSVTVTATSTKTGYADQTATWQFYAEKKPVNALVTAASKTYDGNKSANVTATLQTSDFVGTDSFTITLTGCTFEDPNAGTDKKVNVVSTNPTFTINAGGTNCYENYAITYPSPATASIFKADVTGVSAPTAETGLTYTGLPLPLVTAGTVTEGGTMEYSVDGTNYSTSLPTGTNAGDYEIWYRVKGDGNHNDTADTKLGSSVTITPQDVTAPTIEFNPSGASYDGQEHKPAVTVKDAHGRVIPDSEYTVSYSTTDWKTVSSNTMKHEVTVTDKTGGNYAITEKKQEFRITHAGQTPLSIVGQPGRVQYGDTFTLSAVGGSGTGTVSWGITDNGVASIDQNGLVKVLKSGSATVTATKQADTNYGAVSVTWTFSAEKRPATAIITAKDKEYDQNNNADLVITWRDGDLLNGDTINFEPALTGKFNDANAGTGKTVTITGTAPDSDKYDITFNTTTRASITPQAATLSGTTNPTLTYTGSAQDLVTGVTATNGEVAYSTDGDYYTLLAPTGTNAGTYPVWYKAQASGNYKDSDPVRLNVTINPKTVSNPNIELSSDSFEYDGTAKKPDVVVKDGNTVIPASEYTVSYSNNINVGTATVTISDNPGGNYIVSGSKTFTIKAAKATLTIAPQAKDLTYTSAPQELVSRGVAANGTVVYSQTETGSYTTAIPRQTNAGNYEVWYKVQNTDGTDATSPQYLPVTIARKTITAQVLLDPEGFTYSGDPCTPDVFVLDLDSNTEISSENYTIRYLNNTKVGTAKVIVTGKGNYSFSVITTFEIVAAKAKFTTSPTAITGLTYNGTAQALVTAGAAKGGTAYYSLDGVSYLPTIPTAINRGSYTVFAKVQGDSTHEDSDVIQIPVTIGMNALAADQLTVSLSASNFPYTGGEVKPTVTVTDDSGNVISADEYTVTYSDNVNVGTAKVSIKSKAGGNYSFTASAQFQIIDADQTPLAITGKKGVVYYGDTLSLGTSGGSGGGAVTWSSSNTDVAEIDTNGTIQKIKTSGSVTITATKAASGSYEESTDTWRFYAQPKPVTATVTAANKVYDGNINATLTVTLNGLLPGESVTSVTATGHFADENVGTDKTVVITGLTIPDEVGKLYAISHSGPTTASITPAPAAVTTAPTLATGSLTYNGGPQALLANGGTAANGNLMYSLDGMSYSYTAPTGTDAKTYTVWYKVEATDDNHKDSAAVKLGTVTISANIDTPTVLCTPATVPYDGTEKTPAVVVRDSGNRIIPESEYTVTLPQNRIAVGTYTVTVTDNLGGNYNFTNPVTGTFEIVSASQNPLSIVTDKSTDVYYGDTFRLSAMGGSGSGAVKWSIEGAVATINANGVVTVTGTGGFTVTAYRAGADGYSDSNTDRVPFEAKPKPVTPVVTASDKSYDGTTDATLTASWKSGDLVSGDTITLTVSGTFATADAGTGKRVSIIGSATGTDTTLAKYAITWPDNTTASIYKVDAKLNTAPAAADLTYSGSAQALVTAGITENGIGTVEYATSQNGAYSETIPTGTNAGQYTVWYKVADSVNYTGITPASVEVEIKKAEPTITTYPTATGRAGQKLSEISFNPGGATDVDGTFAWESPGTEAVAGTAYNVIFTPDDTANYNTVTFTLTPVSTARTVSTSRPTQTTVENGTASTKVSASDGSKLVQEAVDNHSDSIVIQPEITENVTKTEVSIPASTVKEINSRTNAALTVSAPVADVTIPNAALESLGSAGGTLDVVTQRQDDGTVALTLSAGGKTVGNVPGGVTLTVPAEDSKPGTVAMLVHEDGTREVIRKSVAKGGAVNIPLSGSATVVLVDNSMEFTDVPPTDEEAGVIAFASAHQLFTGTSAATFSPDAAMSRGMVATVLHRLEGCPVQDTTSAFSDVSSDAWYAGGVAWAASNGIVTGGENDRFNPDEGVTQEQFVLMLWRYAGKPDTSAAEAEPAGSEAQKALRWAAEKSVLLDGQVDSDGALTRIQAAQMLKNFMENV